MNPKHPPGPPMTLGNMREVGVHEPIGACLFCAKPMSRNQRGGTAREAHYSGYLEAGVLFH
jgi:hypothetical protein